MGLPEKKKSELCFRGYVKVWCRRYKKIREWEQNPKFGAENMERWEWERKPKFGAENMEKREWERKLKFDAEDMRFQNRLLHCFREIIKVARESKQ